MSTEPASLESLCVLYHSDDYIVVDKHWDIRIDSKMWYETNTVQAQLRHRFPQLADPRTYYGFRSESLYFLCTCQMFLVAGVVLLFSSSLTRFCHQLDFSTSGALCVALNKAAAGRAYRCFKDRTVTKFYLALVWAANTVKHMQLCSDTLMNLMSF